MESENVLAQYLGLFSSDFQQFKYYLAPNSELDWFGRTVRGHAKINTYLRYEVLSKYEHHNFEKVVTCEPIELKPTHLKTKIVVTSEEDHIHPLNRVAVAAASLKTYAESDLEDDFDDDDNDKAVLLTPKKTSNNSTSLIETELTPPSSIIKQDDNDEKVYDLDSDDCEDVDFMEMRSKRLKRSPPPPFSYLRRLPTTMKRVGDAKTLAETRSVLDEGITATVGEGQEEDNDILAVDVANEYTSLRYLATEGVLRASNCKDSGATWDLPVRIRISYRRRKSDQELQFALIIYDHMHVAAQHTIKPHLRRNLMADFDDTNETATEVTVNDGVTVPSTCTAAVEEQTVESASINTTTVQMEIAMDSDLTQFTIVPLRTPTKTIQTPPATPKRKSRHHMASQVSGLKRLHMTPSTSADAATAPKRSAARNLRL